MRWFKHLSNASDDERLSEIMDLFGAEGYGVYWIILEKIAFLMDKSPKTSARYSVKKWSKFCGKSPKVFRKFLETFEKLSLFNIEICENNSDFLIIDCPNLLKYRDEYSKKSGQTPDNVQNESGESQDQDRDTEAETEKNYSEDSKEFRLSVFLLNNIRKRKPDFKMPNLQVWSKQSDYILRIDRRDPHEIKEVIEWCQTDEFWQDNILSTAKLRKQYDQLVLKMNKKTGIIKTSDRVKLSFNEYKEAFKNKIDNPEYIFKDQSMNKILKEYPFILEYDIESKKFELTYKKYLEL